MIFCKVETNLYIKLPEIPEINKQYFYATFLYFILKEGSGSDSTIMYR